MSVRITLDCLAIDAENIVSGMAEFILKKKYMQLFRHYAGKNLNHYALL